MTAISQRAIDGDVPRTRRERLQDFPHHDRPMRAGRRLAAGEDFLHVVGIAFGLKLLVLLMELPRVSAAITGPARRS